MVFRNQTTKIEVEEEDEKITKNMFKPIHFLFRYFQAYSLSYVKYEVNCRTNPQSSGENSGTLILYVTLHEIIYLLDDSEPRIRMIFFSEELY